MPQQPRFQTITDHDNPGLDFTADPGLTQQHFRDECDINLIMKNYTSTSLLPVGTTQTAAYGDFSTVDDYLTALLTIETARDQFNELPAAARKRFNNDPADFLTFIHDPANIDEARQLGLLKDVPKPPEATPPAPPPVVKPPEPPKP